MLIKQFFACSILGLAMVNSLVMTRADEILVLVAGGDRNAVDIPALEAKLYEPFGVEFDSKDNLWIVEMASGNRLLRVDSRGQLAHVAGKFHTASTSVQNSVQGDGGPGMLALFNGPHNLAIDSNDGVLIADTWNGRIRHVDPRTFMVKSIVGFEVSPEKAKSSGPYCISLDPSKKKVLIADLNRIVGLDLESGSRSIVAGNGAKGVPVDGSRATESPLVDPRAAAADSLGNVYILERGGNALRVVHRDGVIKTVVNASGKKGMSNLAGPAMEAPMNGPKHLCIDRLNRVVIADAENHIVLRYDPMDGTVRRIAGTGKSGREGINRNPLECQLARPHGVTVHPKTGELLITDSYNDRILRIAEK
jgi:DNA-binding beta-propeller fold protein YncE